MARSEYPSIQELEETYILSNIETLFYKASQFRLQRGLRTQWEKRLIKPHIIEHRSRNSARYCLFATDFSTILTQKAIGTAYVVAPPSSTTDDSDGLAPSDTSVWTCRKAPALDRNSRVKRLIWVNSKTKEERDRWSR